ncbi:hypothetical protein HID58_085836, partial [Brassica napus]
GFLRTIGEEITKEKMRHDEANGDENNKNENYLALGLESSPFKSLGGKDSKSRQDVEKESSRSRGKGRESERSRERDRERDRHSERDDDDHRIRRRRSRDREREERHRRRSRSRSRSRSRRSEHRSRSRSRPPSKSKRVSGFDMPPPSSAMLAPTAVAAAVQAMTQQATRHARRVYVGGLPPTANEQSVATFFSQVMSAVGGNTAGPGDAVVNVYINHEKKFAFVEMRSVEEASNAMALDGIILEGVPVKVKRPTDYNPSLAAALGPSQPNPNLNLAAVGFSSGSTGGLEGPDRLFVGGIPYYLTEDQIRELLESFGPLRGFNLDPSVTDIACAALNGIKMGNKTLTVRRAVQGAIQPKPEQEDILLHAQQQIALQRLMLQPGGTPTKIVCLTQVVTANVLGDDKEYEDIMEDMRQEGGKFGNLVNVVIPRPNPEHDPTPGVGKVFLEYADLDSAAKARSGMNGRKFDGNQVVAVYYPENKYAQGDYEAC